MATQAIPRTDTQSVFPIRGIRDWRIRTKLLLLFLIFGVLPSGILGGLTFQVFRDVVSNQAATILLGHSLNTAGAIDQYLTDRRIDVVAASQLPVFSTYFADPTNVLYAQDALRTLRALASRPDYESVALVDRTGKLVLSSYSAENNTFVEFNSYFTEPMKGSDFFISDISVSPITNRPAIFFSAPIRDAVTNRIVGVLVARLGLGGIWGLVEHDKDVAGTGSYGMLLDEYTVRIANSLSLGRRDEMEGSLLFFSAVAPVSPEQEKGIPSERRFGVAPGAFVQVVPIPEVAQALVTPGIKTFETSSDVNTERNIAAIAALSVKPWRYVIMSPFSSFFSELNLWSTIYILANSILIGVIILVSYFVARGFTNPISRLTQVADRISLGELDAKIDVDRKDEIGELAEAVSRMQASLQAAIERLRARRTAG